MKLSELLARHPDILSKYRGVFSEKDYIIRYRIIDQEQEDGTTVKVVKSVSMFPYVKLPEDPERCCKYRKATVEEIDLVQRVLELQHALNLCNHFITEHFGVPVNWMEAE